MEAESLGWATALYHYARALWAWWFLIVSSFVFTSEQFLERFLPSLTERFNQLVLPERRRRLFNGLALFCAFLAGFLAWWDEQELRSAAQTDLAVRSGELRRADEELRKAQVEVASLRQVPSNQELAALRDDLARLREANTIRGLTEEQKQQLLASLPEPDVANEDRSFLIWYATSEEAFLVARDLTILLGSAGWQPRAIPREHIFGRGISIGPGFGDVDLRKTAEVYRALENAGLPVTMHEIPSAPRMIIRDKPHLAPED